jgi:DNA-binding MarR family transcriptional regulator
MATAVDYRALAEFRYQIRRFLTFSEEQARAVGIEPQQHQLLLAIKGLPSGERPTIRTLAERLQLRHHTVVELVNRLEAKRLAVRRPSDADRREIMVEVTEKGARLLRQLSVAHRAELRSAAPRLIEALESIAPTTRAKRPRRSPRVL